jgi:hypothetical protein
LSSCTEVRKKEPKFPGVDPATGKKPTRFCGPGVGVRVGVRVRVAVTLPTTGVEVAVGEGAAAVAVAVGPPGVAVTVGVPGGDVGVAVGVPVGVSWPIGVSVGMAVTVAVWVGVVVSVAVGVAVGGRPTFKIIVAVGPGSPVALFSTVSMTVKAPVDWKTCVGSCRYESALPSPKSQMTDRVPRRRVVGEGHGPSDDRRGRARREDGVRAFCVLPVVRNPTSFVMELPDG